MNQPGPGRTDQSYRHEAFLWRDADDYTAGLVPFLEDALAAGEPTMVAVIDEHAEWLSSALGDRAEEITFVDMRDLGGNPARIIPAWKDFVDAHTDSPVRGVGEPIWPGRRAAELQECQLHEALLNVAVDPGVPFWLICPYDADRLSPAVIDEAHRSHPVIVEADLYSGSTQYAGRPHVDCLFSAELSQPGRRARPARFSPRTVSRLFTYLKLELYVAGLAEDEAGALATVIQRLAESSLQRGSAGGTVRVWCEPGSVICEVADDAVVTDPLLGRRLPDQQGHDALWLANQVCDLVQLRSTPRGTAVRVHRWS